MKLEGGQTEDPKNRCENNNGAVGVADVIDAQLLVVVSNVLAGRAFGVTHGPTRLARAK